MSLASRAYLETPRGRARMRDHVRELRRSAVIDMSAQAVDARIRKMSALRRLCLELQAASR
jgi:hypothetical protein